MKFLYVPWRSKYIKEKETNSNECTFCKKLSENQDQKNYILARYKYNFIILNLYPYNAGHIMLLPLRHVRDLENMSKEERSELIELSNQAIKILEDKLSAQGTNLGANIGKASGAGIPEHFHLHIIPRYEGDTNFLPIIAQTKTISLDLNKIYKDLKESFEKIKLS